METEKVLRELYEACEAQWGRTISGTTRYAAAVLRAREHLARADFDREYPMSSPRVRAAELRMLADMEGGAK